MRKIAVYVLTHNRPQTLQYAIDSIKRQTVDNFDIIISDNSDNLDTYKIYGKIVDTDNRFHYIYHKGMSSANEHFNYILTHNHYDFFIMFHDDDVMLPNMVEDLYNEISKNDNVVAVGCNAYLNINGKNTKQRFNKSTTKKVIKNPLQVIDSYINLTTTPFPAYMYRREKVQGLKMDFNKGGKYCDFSFIVDLANRGSIILIHNCDMYYYISNIQSSHTHVFSQYVTLTNYFKNKYKCKEALITLRVFNIYNALKQEQIDKGKIPFRRMILKIFYKYSFSNYFVKYILRLLNLYK